MIGGFFGAILGFLAAVPVTFGIAAVTYQLCLNDGGVYKDSCGLTFIGVSFYYFLWIALVTTIVGIILGVKISNNYQIRQPPPGQPSELEPPNR